MPAVHDKPPRYRSYLLRMWEARGERADKPPTWRFRLQDARTGAERAFSDLEAVIAFLRAEMEQYPGDPAPGPSTGTKRPTAELSSKEI